MAQDLPGYLDLIKRSRPDDLLVVSRELDPAYEITALVVKLEREARRRPVVICERVKGTSFPVLTNLHASRSRLAVAMGAAPDDGSGLTAVTQFRVVRRFPQHALCEARPLTGRQHQIRVHFAALGHPLVGDKLYGAGEEAFMRACDEGLTPELLDALGGLPRHALHAHRLTFPHPRTRAPMTVESPLARDLVDYMDALARD